MININIESRLDLLLFSGYGSTNMSLVFPDNSNPGYPGDRGQVPGICGSYLENISSSELKHVPTLNLGRLEVLGKRRSVRWPCDECGRVFTDPHSRKQHREAIHEKVKYTCDCGRAFSYRNTLQRHQKYNCVLKK